MVNLGPLLNKITFDIQEIHNQIIRGIWVSVFTFFLGGAILLFIFLLIGQDATTSGRNVENIFQDYLISYLVMVIGGVLLIVPALIGVRYSLSKSNQERKYVPALQDLISWIFFLSLGGVGSILWIQSGNAIFPSNPFGSPTFTLSNILLAVGLLAIYCSIGMVLVLNFLLGITTLFSFVSEYHEILFSVGEWVWSRIVSSRPVLALRDHLEYCKNNNTTLIGGLILRLKENYY